MTALEITIKGTLSTVKPGAELAIRHGDLLFVFDVSAVNWLKPEYKPDYAVLLKAFSEYKVVSITGIIRSVENNYGVFQAKINCDFLGCEVVS